MTLNDLQNNIKKIGLYPVTILPWPQKTHLLLVTKDILEECKENFPSVSITDLISPFVWIVLKKEKDFF